MYKINFTLNAKKDLLSLPRDVCKRILEKIELYANNPYQYAIKLNNPILGAFRFRIGDYRVIFDIVDDTIFLLKVGHRNEIYKK